MFPMFPLDPSGQKTTNGELPELASSPVPNDGTPNDWSPQTRVFPGGALANAGDNERLYRAVPARFAK